MALASVLLMRGKTARITDGTIAIGRALTLEYLRKGANVNVNHLGLGADEMYRRSFLKRLRN